MTETPPEYTGREVIGMKGRWSADWWLSCGICGGQDWVEGTFGTHRPPSPLAREKGWKLTRAFGWCHGDCIDPPLALNAE